MIIRIIIPGFGKPCLDDKIAILKNNLEVIARTAPLDAKLDVHLHVYDDSTMPVGEYALPFHVHRKAGIVGNFIEQHAKDPTIHESEKVMMILDDVELNESFNLREAIRIQENMFFDIISPTLTQDSPTFYDYMRTCHTNTPVVHITSACEMFCYVMPTNSFLKWAQHLDPRNPWLWGMDLLLTRKFDLRVGMLPSMTVTHYFQSLSYDAHPHIKPFECFHAYLRKYGESHKDISQMKAIISIEPIPLKSDWI